MGSPRSAGKASLRGGVAVPSLPAVSSHGERREVFFFPHTADNFLVPAIGEF